MRPEPGPEYRPAGSCEMTRSNRRAGLWGAIAGLAAAAMVVGPVLPAAACPFCSAVAQTFTEEINSMDVAVIAKLVKIPPPSDEPGEELAKATFEVSQVIKGEGLVKKGEKIETLYFGDGTVGRSFLVMGIDPPKTMWSTPLPLTDRSVTYLNAILKLPKDGAERLVFFQKYLEDEDELLARDAYDEFARAPYDQVKAIKEQMNHEQIVAWIKNPEIPASRRRLYLVMLGVCGGEQDLPMLAEFMQSSDRKQKAGLDALIACYLTLKGESGLKLVEDLFLANPKADYADTYSAIMAIRFHGTEGGVIEKAPLVKALHHMLDRPDLADLVIPDLAKWEDWGSMDRLMALYRSADEKNSWVRVPVVNFLRSCPLPRAKELLVECEKIDPAAVKRANSFFPTAPASAAPTPPADTSSQIPAKPSTSIAAAAGKAGAPIAAASTSLAQPDAPDDDDVALFNQGVAPAAALKITPTPAPNLWLILGVPWAVGLCLFAVQWTVLRGR
jgi:hypothetical protein